MAEIPLKRRKSSIQPTNQRIAKLGKHDIFGKDWYMYQLEHMQVTNGTGSFARWRKYPLPTRNTRRRENS